MSAEAEQLYLAMLSRMNVGNTRPTYHRGAKANMCLMCVKNQSISAPDDESMGLDEQQMKDVSKLPTGQASSVTAMNSRDDVQPISEPITANMR